MSRPYKTQVRHSFDKAARAYAANADFQMGLRNRLLSFSGLLNPPSAQFKHILDAGCGSGTGFSTLKQFFPHSKLCGLDLAEAMLSEAARQRHHGTQPHQLICGDLETQPFADDSFDLVFCNAALQWCEKPADAIAEFNRVLTTDGLLLIATYGPQTLYELRNSWARVDQYSHTLTFPDCRQLVAALETSGFAEIRSQSQTEVALYADVNALLVSLKTIGARNCRADRPSGLSPPAKMRAMAKRYAADHQMPDGRIPATYETIFLRAR